MHFLPDSLDARRPLPYQWLLPFGQLLLCLVALWPLRQPLRENASILWNDAMGPTRGFLVVPPGHVADQPDIRGILTSSNDRDPSRVRLRIPVALDLPALLVQLPYVIVNPEQTTWRPQGISLTEWNAMFLPFAGLIFWWSAGRGFEAFLSATRKVIFPHITWLESICAVTLFLAGIVVMCGVAFSSASQEHSLRAGAAGFALWCGLSVPMILAKVLQIRLAAANS